MRALSWLLLIATACEPTAQSQSSPAPERSTETRSDSTRLVADASALCRAAAEVCARAMVTQDAEGMLACTAEEVVTVAGGRDAFVRLVDKAKQDMAAEGASMVSVVLASPSQMLTEAGVTYAIVPQTLTMKVGNERFRQQSFLLGLSRDAGKTWRFADGVGVRSKNSSKVFPNLPQALELPPKAQPEPVTD